MSLFSRIRAGFTLVELMVSIGIFVAMTALLVSKYGNFNQSVLLNNLAYDVALTLRTAQTYGLSVQAQQISTIPSGSPSPITSAVFQYPYGVAFCANNCSNGQTNKQIILFSDRNSNAIFDPTDVVVSTYAIKRGGTISGISINSTNFDTTGNDRIDISFQRPYPDAIICLNGSSLCTINGVPNNSRTNAFSKIFIQASDGSKRAVVVRRTGQISVEE